MHRAPEALGRLSGAGPAPGLCRRGSRAAPTCYHRFIAAVRLFSSDCEFNSTGFLSDPTLFAEQRFQRIDTQCAPCGGSTGEDRDRKQQQGRRE